MTGRRTRVVLTVIGLIVAAAAALAVLQGASVFGDRRANENVFDHTVVHWFNEGGWKSYAVIDAIGVVVVILGLILMITQLRFPKINRTPTITLPAQPGSTTVRPSAISHGTETDLESSPSVTSARVRLRGHLPNIAVHADVTITDDANLDTITTHCNEVIGRLEQTIGRRPNPVNVTISFADTATERKLA